MELAEGVILDGHYRLRQMLGRGGMGEVWAAEHTRLPKQFAIKFLLGLSHAEPELLMRFKREAEIASRLAHPSIVQVTDFNILPDGTAYIAMERLIGEDLRARLRRGPLKLAEVREITRQVGSALQLAHREGIVHRDLKPENIFLCREPDGALRAKLLDFGISKLQGAVTGTRDDRVLGTPGYMAPEQAMGKNSVIDGRTDLFSFATIVYEMLTGEGVFVGDTLAELCTKVLFHTPTPLDQVLPSVPHGLASAVATALSKDPSARQADMRTFADQVTGVSSPPSSVSPSAAVSGFGATMASDAAGPRSSLGARAATTESPSRALPIDAADFATRSERPSLPSPSHPVRQRKRTIALVSAGVLLLLGGAVTFELREARRRAPQTEPLPESPEPVVPSPAAPPSAATGADQAVPEQKAAATAEVQAVGQPRPRGPDPGALSAKQEPGSRARPKPTGAPLSGDAEAALADAERAIERGDAVDALRLARNSMRESSSERAYLVMARAYCRQRDVGMVQAMLRNLSIGLRKQVRADCQSQGLVVP